MKLRVAKKLVRYAFAYDVRERRYKGTSMWLAYSRIDHHRRGHYSGPLTPGYRWGRWDPLLPQDPTKPPF